jgi:hypothetical protein
VKTSSSKKAQFFVLFPVKFTHLGDATNTFVRKYCLTSVSDRTKVSDQGEGQKEQKKQPI